MLDAEELLLLLLLLLLLFYGPWYGTTRVSLYQKRHFIHSHLKSSISVAGGLSSFWILRGVGKIIKESVPTIRLDATPSGPLMPPRLHHPPVLRQMPFLPQPSQIVLAWDMHQICWIAYLEACLMLRKPLKTSASELT